MSEEALASSEPRTASQQAVRDPHRRDLHSIASALHGAQRSHAQPSHMALTQPESHAFSHAQSSPKESHHAFESCAHDPPETGRNRKTKLMHEQSTGASIAKARAQKSSGPHVPRSRSSLPRALSIDLSSQ